MKMDDSGRSLGTTKMLQLRQIKKQGNFSG